MLKEIAIILLTLAAIAAIAIYYIKALSKEVEEEEEKPKYSLENLMELVNTAFSNRLKENLKELNLDKNQLLSERRKKIDLRKNIKNASFGDPSAKRYLKDAIRAVLQSDAIGIDETTINIPIPFNNPQALSMRQKTDIVLHIYEKNYAEAAFDRLMKDYHLDEPKKVTIEEEYKGKLKYVITTEEMNNIFYDLIEKYPLSFNDKFEVLTQYIFAQTYGAGVVDQLIQFYIDEIQGGTGGTPYGHVVKEKIDEYFHYSYEDVRVIYRGNKYKLDCMTFGSQTELIRICKNIYKYSAKHALTQSNPHVVETMMDGSRISVSRPGESGWLFLLRKFDSISMNPTFEELYGRGNNHWQIPETIIRYMVHTQKSLAITGAMAVGKSTLLRVIIGYVPSEKAIRTIEQSSELNLSSYYSSRGIAAFETSETTTMQDLYSFIKKTSSDLNIVGETASPEERIVAIQSTQSGSEMAIITSHPTSTEAFVTEMADTLTTYEGYTDRLAAEQVIIDGFKFDVHLANYGGMRYIERITEIVPSMDRRYPSDIAKENGEKNILPGGKEDELEYWKRTTDRKAYKCVNIVEFSLSDMSYHMTNPISDSLKNEMLKKLNKTQREEFINDMNILESTIGR